MSVTALLLAAGAGTRMGGRSGSRGNKLLLEYRGVPLVRHLANVANGSRCDALHVVLGAGGDEVARALEGLDARIVENEDWASGLASSIRLGISAITSQRADCDAVVVLLADQPDVTSGHIDALLDVHERLPDHLVASGYDDVEGVPALFPRRSFDALQRLDGDAGARSLLAAERATSGRIVTIPFPPAAFDIDTPEDYAALREREHG